MRYLLERLKEPSTWRGLCMGAAALGASWSPDHQQAIVTIGVGAAGLLGTILPDSWLK